MTTPQDPAADGPSPDHSRSGDDVADAVRTAEQGSSVQEPHDRGAEAKSGQAPVERSAGDPEMTEGQVVYGEGEQAAAPAPGTAPAPTEQSSGIAQSAVGARASDRVAAGEEPEQR
jgi:hypothetical protein